MASARLYPASCSGYSYLLVPRDLLGLAGKFNRRSYPPAAK